MKGLADQSRQRKPCGWQAAPSTRKNVHARCALVRSRSARLGCSDLCDCGSSHFHGSPFRIIYHAVIYRTATVQCEFHRTGIRPRACVSDPYSLASPGAAFNRELPFSARLVKATVERPLMRAQPALHSRWHPAQGTASGIQDVLQLALPGNDVVRNGR